MPRRSRKKKKYSVELKIQAIKEWNEGRGSQYAICKEKAVIASIISIGTDISVPMSLWEHANKLNSNKFDDLVICSVKTLAFCRVSC